MQSDITIPDLFLLEDIAAELARTAQLAGDRPNASALNKAAYRLPGVYDVLRFSAGDLLIPSATSAGQLYRVSAAGCSCEAGIHGRACWHSALAEIILVATTTTATWKTATRTRPTRPRLMWIVSRFCVQGRCRMTAARPTSHRCARGWHG
jgi:hypothetical protein